MIALTNGNQWKVEWYMRSPNNTYTFHVQYHCMVSSFCLKGPCSSVRGNNSFVSAVKF